jgi:hypothetical protein
MVVLRFGVLRNEVHKAPCFREGLKLDVASKPRRGQLPLGMARHVLR